MTKILITTGIFEPESGGPATYAPKIANKLIEAGHQVKIITYSDKKKFDFDKNYNFELERVKRTKNKVSNYFRFFITILKQVRKYEIVYSLDWLTAGLPVSLACRIMRKKYILRIGGGYIWERYLMDRKPPLSLKEFYRRDLHKKYKEYKLMFLLIRFVLRGAERIIFNTVDQKELYIKPYSLDKNKLVTIFNPIPKPEVLGKIKRDGLTNEIVFAGRFIVMKNIESLINAFAKAKIDKKLILIGNGPLENDIYNLVKELNIIDKVEFLSPMQQQELYERIKNCYYLILPSWTDISPNQIYESLSLRIPFLLTKENYLSINKYDFIKIDPHSVEDIAEKMIYLENKNNYNTFIDSLNRIDFKYNWNDVLDEHIKLINEII